MRGFRTEMGVDSQLWREDSFELNGSEIAYYDRGWRTEPVTHEAKTAVALVLKMFK